MKTILIILIGKRKDSAVKVLVELSLPKE